MQSDEHINLKVTGQDGSVVHFKIKKNTALRKLMSAYCERTVCYVQYIDECSCNYSLVCVTVYTVPHWFLVIYHQGSSVSLAVRVSEASVRHTRDGCQRNPKLYCSG